jgi:hypothetical protein
VKESRVANNLSKRLLQRRILRASEKGEAIDLLNYGFLAGQFRVFVTGGMAGTLALQHASANEEPLFVTLGTTVPLYSGTGTVQLNSSFLRYVRFVTSSDVTNSPEASLDIVAKQYGSNQSFRILDRRVIRSDETSEIIDLGAFRTLCVCIRVAVGGGGGGTIELQHAAIAEPSAFTPLGNTVNLIDPTVNVQTQTGFLRYIRWLASSNIAGSPEAVIDIIAKEF